MKQLRFLFILLFSSSIFCQNDLLGLWNLHYLTYNGSQEINIYNENSYITFNDVGGFDGIAICNGFAGSYNIIDTSTVDIYLDSWTLGSCDPPETLIYEDKYELILSGISPTFHTFTYEIIGAGDVAELFLTSVDGDVLKYGRQSLSVDDNNMDREITVYPNPTADVLNIKRTDSENITYSILSINGKMIREDAILRNNTVDVRLLKSGLYFLQLKIENSLKTLKFTKQ